MPQSGSAPVRSLADAEPTSSGRPPGQPPPRPGLDGPKAADLVIIGGGFTGLWAAIQAKEQDPPGTLSCSKPRPSASARRDATAASSMAPSPTGYATVCATSGKRPRCCTGGPRNLDAMAATLHRYHIDADWDPRGILHVATQPYQLNELHDEAALLRVHGETATVLDASQTRAELDSPTFVGGCRRSTGKATVNPILLAWGLRRAAEQLGTRIYEHSPVLRLRAAAPRHRAHPAWIGPGGRAIIGTSAYPSPLRAIRRYVAPVYDYVLVTEPLTTAQLCSLGWQNRLPVRTQATSSTTTGSRLITASCGAGTTRSTTTEATSDPTATSARHLHQARRALLRHLSPAAGNPIHPPLGRRDRHLYQVLRHIRHRV